MTNQITNEYHTPVEAIGKTCCVDLSKKCETTACMGWRWGPLREGKILHTLPYLDKDGKLLQHPRTRVDVPKELRDLRWKTVLDKDTRKYTTFVVYEQISQGYCGRAGNPDPVIEVNT